MIEQPTVSIVVPLYNERENVDPLDAEIASAMSAFAHAGGVWEVIYVDDGSTDGTYERLAATQASHPDVVSVVRLRRNFGQTAALAAGFDQVRGRVIVMMDGDIQNDAVDLLRVLELFSRVQ